jgi:hypothetical protein
MYYRKQHKNRAYSNGGGIPHMTNRRIFTVATTAVVIGLVALASAAPLPMRLTDLEFW